MDNQERAQKIRDIMQEQDMTMARLSRKITLHVNTVRNVLDGEHDITVLTLKKIAAGLEVKAAELL